MDSSNVKACENQDINLNRDEEMNQVQQFNERINDVMVQNELESVDENFYVSEVEDQIKYDVDIEIELDQYAVTNQN